MNLFITTHTPGGVSIDVKQLLLAHCTASRCIYTVVLDGLVSVNLTFGDEVLALAANEHIKLRRGLVEQQPTL